MGLQTWHQTVKNVSTIFSLSQPYKDVVKRSLHFLKYQDQILTFGHYLEPPKPVGFADRQCLGSSLPWSFQVTAA